MAEERLSALARKLGPFLEVHHAAWAGAVGAPGELWVEEEGRARWVVRILKSPIHEPVDTQGRLVRRAGVADAKAYKARLEEAEVLRRKAQARAQELGLSMRFVGAELDLGRSFLRLYFTAQDRQEFRDLLRDLSAAFKLRLELRQIGPRDAARILGTVGPCGHPLCCRTFLHRLRPVPLELAFEQQLLLSPERLTGACGRLKCCLAYEHEQYLEALNGLPKPGQEVQVEGRTGEIIGYHFFRGTALLEWSDGTRGEIPWDRVRR